MVWIEASWIVTTMENRLMARNIKVTEKMQRKAVDKMHFAVHHHLPVSPRINAACPYPTVSIGVNNTFSEKSLLWGSFARLIARGSFEGKMVWHTYLQYVCYASDCHQQFGGIQPLLYLNNSHFEIREGKK
jgi:hypothetical protein